jgi:hypothetical protein
VVVGNALVAGIIPGPAPSFNKSDSHTFKSAYVDSMVREFYAAGDFEIYGTLTVDSLGSKSI